MNLLSQAIKVVAQVANATIDTRIYGDREYPQDSRRNDYRRFRIVIYIPSSSAFYIG